MGNYKHKSLTLLTVFLVTSFCAQGSHFSKSLVEKWKSATIQLLEESSVGLSLYLFSSPPLNITHPYDNVFFDEAISFSSCNLTAMELVHYEINNCVDDENINEYTPTYPNTSSCNSLTASSLYSPSSSEGCHNDAGGGSGYSLCVGSQLSLIHI